MVRQGFSIGKRDWYVMVYYDVADGADLYDVYEALVAGGCPRESADKACDVLSGLNHGYTYTNYKDHLSLLFISRASSAEQMFDSIVHELKHLVEHISSYYGVDPKEELSAYLQGEVGRLMFPAASLVLCPNCEH